jgi:hypothetical protein
LAERTGTETGCGFALGVTGDSTGGVAGVFGADSRWDSFLRGASFFKASQSGLLFASAGSDSWIVGGASDFVDFFEGALACG